MVRDLHRLWIRINMASRPIVFLPRGLPPEPLKQLWAGCEVREWTEDRWMTKEEVKQHARGVHALVTCGRDDYVLGAEVLDAIGPQLKVVATYSVGLEHLDLAECRKRGIAVGYTPGVLTNAVAELGLGLLITTARRMKEAMAAAQSGVWGTRWDEGLWMTGLELAGSTVGVVGLGRIGTAVAKRIRAFEPARLLYYDIVVNPRAAEMGAELVTFPELLKCCDAVIVTAAATAANKHLFNKDAFSRMKSSAIFVNVARGHLVDHGALLQALTSGQIGAAGLDATSPEPLPTDHPLLQLPNCTVLPHIGSATRHARTEMCRITVNNILAGLKGQPLPSPVP